jgi:hypothetical protein
VPEKSWCQQSSGVNIVLVSVLFWCHHFSGVSIVLVPALFWYQYFSGVSKVLMSANPGARKALVQRPREKKWKRKMLVGCSSWTG